MKKQMGIILITIGAVLIVCGCFFIFSKKRSYHDISTSQPIEQLSDKKATQEDTPNSSPLPSATSSSLTSSSQSESSSATQISNAKQKGNDFEGYVADILKDNNFQLKEWNQGTISPNGAYAENEFNPDFRVVDKDNKLEYWIECKYRSSLPPEGFSLEAAQLSRYHQIQGKSKKKVLITVGVGGSANAPDKFYIIPLDSLVRFKRIGHKFLPHYSVINPKANFKKHVSDWFFNEVFKK